MRIATVLVAVSALLVLSPAARSQSTSPVESKSAESPKLPRRGFHPKLTLQDALPIAEKYIVTKKIDATHFWLYSATFIGYGASGKSPGTPGWHFWWVNDSGSLGNYIEIFVSMDGKAMLLPSM